MKSTLELIQMSKNCDNLQIQNERLKVIITEREQTIDTLKEALTQVAKTALFYQKCSADKATFKFGYSRVIEDAKKHLCKVTDAK